jgi:uncharacterized protein
MAGRTKQRTSKAPRSRVAPFARGAGGRCLLVVMAKQPVMGRVKSRLAAQVGGPEAVRFYRNCLRALVTRLGADPRWRTLLAIAPDTACGAPVWPRSVGRIAQGRGDLGQRMQRLLEIPHAYRVVVVGTDIPAIRPVHIARAFRLLGNHTAVVGPAEDGGYWLVGMKRCPRVRRPFAGVRWSAPQTLADTLANLSGTRVGLAATLSDVDTAPDLARFGPIAARLVAPRHA